MHEPTTTTTTETGTQRRAPATVVGVSAMILAAVAFAIGISSLVLATGNGSTEGTESVAATGEPRTVEVSLREFSVTPSTVEVPAGSPLTLEVTNDGTMPHDLKLEGEVGTDLLQPGESQTVELGPIEATSEAWCTVPGHKQAGMTMTIEVTGEGAPASATGAAAAQPEDTGATADAATIDVTAEPPPGWQPYDPTLQPAPGATEHRIEMHATEEMIEVAPGVKQLMWTFNGTVPGPVLRGKVGDLFTVTLYNDGTLGHSIDFHASQVAPNDEMRTIAPGESLVYQFRATSSGIFMYHCGTAPVLHHVGNGMYGALIVDPPDLAPVDHEYVFVQSELYLGPEGEVGDLAKMEAEDFDAVMFNGYVNQYAHAPIQVQPGERIRAWVLDAGPSENSAFHVIGTIFDTVYKEGAYLLRRSDGLSGGSQVLDLQPAQGGFVEFSLAEPGRYPMLTHKLANVGKGALGIFQAGDGGPAPTGSAAH
jgi:nitrite reductase (NO-forming)